MPCTTPRFLALAALVVVACAPAALGPTSPPPADPPAGCPLGVAGASVVAEDTPDGIALVFRSKGNGIVMRERAKDAAAQHGPGAHLGRGHGGEHNEWGDHGLRMTQMPAARSTVQEIEGGARIDFVAVDPANTSILRAKLRERVDAMTGLQCTRPARGGAP